MSAFRVASRRATQLSSLHQRGSLGIRPSGQVLLKSRPAASPALQSARWYSTGKAEQASTSAESDQLDGSGSKKEASQEEKKSEDKSQVVDEAHSKALEAKDGEITRLKVVSAMLWKLTGS